MSIVLAFSERDLDNTWMLALNDDGTASLVKYENNICVSNERLEGKVNVLMGGGNVINGKYLRKDEL